MGTFRPRFCAVNFSSTAAVFGEPDYVPIDEVHPRRPINRYGMSNLMVEAMLADFDRAYGLRSVALRYFNAAGADPQARIGERHQPETHLIPLALQEVLGRRPPLKMFGRDYDTSDGTCMRDYIHVDDLADVHLLAFGVSMARGQGRCLQPRQRCWLQRAGSARLSGTGDGAQGAG